MNETLEIKDDELLQRVYNGEKNFTESELADLATEYAEFDIIEGHARRWVQGMTTILKLEDKYFSIDWACGLTEKQDNEYKNQPEEVILSQEEKIITVNSYMKV